MSLCCRFSSCHWCGPEDEIFDHLESYHKKFLREPKGNLYFDLYFDDLQQETFVLCSSNGLYWLRRNTHHPRSNGFDYGVFHIGESEQVEYELKLGLKRDGFCEYWGPYASQKDKLQHSNLEEEYNLEFDFDYLEMLNDLISSRRLRLYFGEYDDSDDKICPGPQDIEWKAEDERSNRLCVERFTCAVCFEYIRRDVRFCENKHYVCLNCFKEMQQRKILKCPTCRGQYLYDCMDDNLERLLGMIKWPDMPEIKMDKEMLEFLKSMPNVEFVKVKGGEHH